MIFSMEYICRQFNLNPDEIEEFIQEEWLYLEKENHIYQFSPDDIERIQLICTLRKELNVNPEGTDIILDMRDKLVALQLKTKHILYRLDENI